MIPITNEVVSFNFHLRRGGLGKAVWRECEGKRKTDKTGKVSAEALSQDIIVVEEKAVCSPREN
jgi:hypothetical protein